MKKNNRVLRIGLLALVLTLVTASLVSGTFAKYVTTASGTGTVTVAKWVAKINGADSAYSSSVTFNPFQTRDSADDVAANHVAPGTAGNFKFEYVTAGSQVDRKITVKLKAVDATAQENLANVNNLFFYDKNNQAFKPTTTDTIVYEKTINYDAVGGENGEADGSHLVNWDWIFGDGTNDAIDTPDGIAAVNANLTLSVTIEQLNSGT